VVNAVHHRVGVGGFVKENDGTAFGFQAEARVCGRGRHVAVGVDHEVSTTRNDGAAGENPLRWIVVGRIIQAHARQVHGVGGRIIEFDPVRRVPVHARRGGVVGQHLVDDDAGGGGVIGDDETIDARRKDDVLTRGTGLMYFDREHVVAGQESV